MSLSDKKRWVESFPYLSSLPGWDPAQRGWGRGFFPFASLSLSLGVAELISVKTKTIDEYNNSGIKEAEMLFKPSTAPCGSNSRLAEGGLTY